MQHRLARQHACAPLYPSNVVAVLGSDGEHCGSAGEEAASSGNVAGVPSGEQCGSAGVVTASMVAVPVKPQANPQVSRAACSEAVKEAVKRR